ncbi:MAG: hypothetical protein IJ343_15500 [Clostridia bacterium]|nr:hypothetical protein [Clostridia bacterium]
MKTGKDFRREFPDMTAGFLEAANRTLATLDEHRRDRRMKIRPVLVFVTVLVLLMGAGVAATWERWSLDDFIPTRRITATEDEWSSMLSAFEPVTAGCAVADVTVREAIFDGYALYIIVDVRSKDESRFFLPEDSDMDTPAYQAARGLPKDMTLREYIVSRGYRQTYEVRLFTSTKGMTFMPEMALNEDGTMTFYLRQRMHYGGVPTEQLEMTLNVTMSETAGSGFYSTKIPLTIRTLPVLEEAVSLAGDRHEFSNIGAALTNLRLIRTPLSTYITVDAEVTDEDAFAAHARNYVIRFADADGRQYDPGPFNLAGFMQDPTGREQRGPLYYMATLTLSSLPDTITVSEYPWGEHHDPEGETDSWHVCLEKISN